MITSALVRSGDLRVLFSGDLGRSADLLMPPPWQPPDADMVVLDKNPLEDIHNSTSIHSIVKNGEMFEGDTMDRLWPSTVSVPKFSWQAQGEMLGKPE